MDIYITGKNSKGNDQKIQIPIIPEEMNHQSKVSLQNMISIN